MYRTATPPVFDIPDFPTLRRVKPLPKRHRTSLNINPDINVNISPSSPGINPTLLSQSNTHPSYITPTYHTHPTQPLSQDILPPGVDAQRSQYDWRLPPDFFLPEEIIRAACVLPESNSTPRIDDGSGSDSKAEGGTEEPFLPPERKTPPLETKGPFPITATPPPPSDASTDDEVSRELTKTSYRPTFFPSPKQHYNHKGLDVEEELDPAEAAEGDLQDRLFLRAETDRLLAHADSISAKMALRSYYHSMGYGVPEFDSGHDASPVPISPVPSSGLDHVADYAATSTNGSVPINGNIDADGSAGDTHPANMTPGNGYVAVGVGRGHDGGDGDGRGGDYPDHLNQQGQGNTKKRKVPANVGSSPPQHHHHLHHYSSHRGAVGTYGSDALGYGQTAGVEGDAKEFSFGLGFGLDLGTDTTAEHSGSGTTLGGVESDVFGPLPGPKGTYQHQHHDHVQMGSTQQLPPRHFRRKAKLSPATLAGLQRKELIRGRKKQLEAIMGTLGDTTALDHALLANFPPLLSSFSSLNSSPSNSPSTDSDHGHTRAEQNFVRPGAENDENWDLGWGWGDPDGKEVRVRLSRREKMRVARTVRMGLGRLGRHPDAAPFPTQEFTFTHPNATAERLATLQQDVANLRNLFGTELARQAAKAAKSAAGAGKSSGGGSGKTGKKRAQQRARTIMSAKSGEQQAEFLEMPQKGADSSGQPQIQSPQVSQTQSQGQTPTPKKGKKKKRSTMANASNPHHLRNYVPSRLPHAAGGGGNIGNHGQGNQVVNVNPLWPLAVKFLSADLPPRRRKDTNSGGQGGVNVQSLPQLVVPQEEWICSFCEYSLFYGEDGEYRRAIRNRKKVLKRRRRARERAAAAASGVNTAMKNAAGVAGSTQVEDEDEEYDGPGYESAPPSSSGARVDGAGRARDREPPG